VIPVIPGEERLKPQRCASEARACRDQIKQGVDVEALTQHLPGEMAEGFAARYFSGM
jgi:hypothetical protein